MTVTSNLVLDSGGSLKQSGDYNPEFARACSEYINRFHCYVKFDRNKLNTKEFYAWCAQHLGSKYKDWFVLETGNITHKEWTLYIKDPKRSTFVRLVWNDAITESVDKKYT